MFELLFLGLLFVVGLVLLKLIFVAFSLTIHLALLPLRILAGVFLLLLLVPVLLLALPVFVAGAVGLGLLGVGALLTVVFGVMSAF